ncbi:MAG: glutamine--fructose-6-phosphate transaminase (isomerizing) [Candidatus Krumholzibacteria bacterium]|nr:glutamine--fructose-6-phosphate transaminase (isomerizing) [Candidatus Krumholzibacteria bacterium]MDP7022538.1 glutamine--fructose-6-phosphate transaminase (isomerizing) [Candidatus Krumholzibacteria bacterium]
MCGIVGYLGERPALPILIEGLKRLEYRGYDSSGIALQNGGTLQVVKEEGKISSLQTRLNGGEYPSVSGIAHTRWATHGVPSRQNAHPHVSASGKIAIVHNGIIENFQALRRFLTEKGYEFTTDTDTETLVHLIDFHYRGDLEKAVQMALARVEGTYGIAVIHHDHPKMMVGARNGSPMVIGIGDRELFLASDVAAILAHTRQVIYLDDREMVTFDSQTFKTKTIHNEAVEKEIQEVTWDLESIEKSGYPHFMLKEIFEQPETIANAFRGRLLEEEGLAKLGGLASCQSELQAMERAVFLACGTSWHAGLIGEYMIEELARIPAEVEYASEFRYRNPVLDENTVTWSISQSGETVDTLEAMREGMRKGARSLGIVNVVGSTIARESEGGVYIHAGPEIGVASTKAFTSQVTVLAILTLLLGRKRGMSLSQGQEMVQELKAIPDKVSQILKKDEEIREIAEIYADVNNFLYLGRGINYPVALEGALKLKEISYIHAEGYPAAEMKHGPIALIDENMPVVFVSPRGGSSRKILGNMEEVRARGGRIIAVTNEGDQNAAALADHVISIPETVDFLSPLLTVIPLQLLAYHIAVIRGCDVDQPRNLAKSVTVE